MPLETVTVWPDGPREWPHSERGAASASPLDALVGATVGVCAALLIDADGAALASRSTAAALAAPQLAAIARDLLLLGRSTLAHAHFGSLDHLVIEAAAGHVVLMPVLDAPRTPVLAVLTRPDAMLGHVLWAARRCRDSVRESAGVVSTD